mmetsp:Transcript_8719/g.13447  ORF Transcript_8719/g.13447 Transcript_8719/m.13447 type:complete len:1175 (-) Transcript_8719:1036-4560(-)
MQQAAMEDCKDGPEDSCDSAICTSSYTNSCTTCNNESEDSNLPFEDDCIDIADIERNNSGLNQIETAIPMENDVLLKSHAKTVLSLEETESVLEKKLTASARELRQKELHQIEDTVSDENEVATQPGAFPVAGRASGERPTWDGSSTVGNEDYDSIRDNVSDSQNTISYPTDIESREFFVASDEILVQAETVQEDNTIVVTAKADNWFRRNQSWLAAVFVLLVVLSVTLTTTTKQDTPSSAPTNRNQGVEEQVRKIISSQFPSLGTAADKADQDKAIEWVSEKKSQDFEWYTDARVIQQYSLVSFFLSTSRGESGSSPWINKAGWMDSTNECKWFGIECDKSGSVASLNLASNNLVGSLEPELLLLSKGLLTLNLTNNKLSQSIPKEIGSLSQLKILDLSQNSITGGLPESLGLATNLLSLDISNNHLLSTIPITIGKLSSLTSINLAHNGLIGSIPSEVGSLVKLSKMDCQHNRLSYELPTEVSKLTSLQELYLQNNDILGPLPSEVGLLTNLRRLDTSKNHIFGGIPVDWYRKGALASLESLDLSNNLLTGALHDELRSIDDFGSSWQKLTSLRINGNYLRKTLPPLSGGLYSLPFLKELDISFNFLTGTLPAGGIAKLSTITTLNLSGNQLKGNLPNELFEASELTLLDLSDNEFHGTLSPNVEKLKNLHHLNLSTSGISGTLPSELGSITDLLHLDVSSNRVIGGNIPTEFGRLINLKHLDMKENNFSGTLPSYLGQLHKLQFLNMSSNRFSGVIPSDIGNLVSLKILKSHVNDLNGSIPSEFENLFQLEELDLYLNNLSGPLPSGIEKLTSLKRLSLFHNSLTGKIPSGLGLLTNLQELFLYSNDLTGPIPSEIGNLRDLALLSLGINQLSGSIPAEFSNLKGLNVIRLSQTSLTGSIPSSICSLTPQPSISVDCENVACLCHACGCTTEPLSVTPPKTPPSQQTPVSNNSVPEYLSPSPSLSPMPSYQFAQYEANVGSCFPFKSIAHIKSALQLSDSGSNQVLLPFTFKWGNSRNFTTITIEKYGNIVLGEKVADCYQQINAATLIQISRPPTAYKGPIFMLSSATSLVVSWEGVRGFDSSDAPYGVNFQTILFANGWIEMRWGEGIYSQNNKVLAALSDSCSNKFTYATEYPFLSGGTTDNGFWPTDQCRSFQPNGNGFNESNFMKT